MVAPGIGRSEASTPYGSDHFSDLRTEVAHTNRIFRANHQDYIAGAIKAGPIIR